jgi:hypothetical protein
MQVGAVNFLLRRDVLSLKKGRWASWLETVSSRQGIYLNQFVILLKRMYDEFSNQWLQPLNII